MELCLRNHFDEPSLIVASDYVFANTVRITVASLCINQKCVGVCYFFYSKPKKNGFLHQTVVSLFGFLCFHFFFFFLNSDLLFVPFTCIVTILLYYDTFTSTCLSVPVIQAHQSKSGAPKQNRAIRPSVLFPLLPTSWDRPAQACR